MSERYQTTIDNFFDFEKLRNFIEQDHLFELGGSYDSRWEEVYRGESLTFTPQSVPRSVFAKHDSFPWLVDLGLHRPEATREYWWSDGSKKSANTVRIHTEAGSLQNGSLQGQYAAIHLETEKIPRKNTSALPSVGNVSVKLVICDHGLEHQLAYRRDHDKRGIGSRRSDYSMMIPSRYFLNESAHNVQIHQQR